MAYTPYEWTVNSYLNPTRMNAIEQGIAAASQAAESASGEFHTIEELIGTQSIAGIGDGTLTGATWKINSDLSDLKNTVTTLNSKLTKLDAIYTSQIINPVNKGFIALNRPNGATGGKVVKLIPLGTAAISKEISIQVGISGNTPYSYFALDDTTFNTIKGYNTVVSVEWRF